MDRKESYTGLRFERRSETFPRRLIPIGVALACFTLLWWLVPHSTLYWLLLPLVGLLTWVASYGWRSAAVALHDLLHRLEEA